MNNGENKTPLALMEQVIMVFVFALAAALCVQVFVYARTVSVSMEERDYAMVECQSVAETAKDCAGNIEEMRKYLENGCVGENELSFYYDEKWEAVQSEDETAYYQIVFHIVELSELCGNGKVSALKLTDGTEICSLPVAWQE